MSATPRLFVKANLVEDAPIALEDDQAHYLLRVLRLKEGDHVRVFNGRHGEWDAVIDQVYGKAGVLKAVSLTREQADVVDLHLLFAPLKKTRTDFVVEKATELGVSLIQPVITDRTQTHRVRTDRLERTALEAAEQTERLDTPIICDAISLTEAIVDWPEERALFFCDEACDDEDEPWGGEAGRARPFLNVLMEFQAKPSAVLIGPEGGFTNYERAILRSRACVIPVTLGPRILRAETAAISALTLWQSTLGDWPE